MAKTWANAPSPCIDVCKFREEGRCLGCAMTKSEKKTYKRLSGKSSKRAFFLMLSGRLEAADRFGYWARMYRRKCVAKGAPCPLDKLESAEEAA